MSKFAIYNHIMNVKFLFYILLVAMGLEGRFLAIKVGLVRSIRYLYGPKATSSRMATDKSVSS